MRISETEAQLFLLMAGAAYGDGLLERGGRVQRLAARAIWWLRRQGWENQDLYVRDAGMMLAWKREAEEEAVAELREELERWDLTSA